MNASVPIPYGGYHVGPRRTLSLTLRGGGPFSARAAHVSVDGSTYVLGWGSTAFEVPADRPVAINVHQMRFSTAGGLATTTLMPHDPPMLEYRSPYHPGYNKGEIGRPGTVRTRGSIFLAGMIFGLILFALSLLNLINLMTGY